MRHTRRPGALPRRWPPRQRSGKWRWPPASQRSQSGQRSGWRSIARGSLIGRPRRRSPRPEPALKLVPRASAPTISSRMPEPRKLEHTVLCCVLLALITVAVYLPVIQLGFVAFDDNYYLTANPKVQAGLTWEGARWAFTRAHAANWHPVTWLSHMLDCQLYGLKPAGHHITNLIFHTANTLLLFRLLQRLTGAFWRSALVAALFALHPLHVESVAWVAERKDVLSTFFGLLCIWAYALYAGIQSLISNVQSRGIGAGSQPSEHATRNTQHVSRFTFHVSSYYLLSLFLFALGLMSKPMLVTWPFVLLLLDWWPLGRLRLSTSRNPLSAAARPASLWRLVAEKAPFFALSAASCVVTVIAQDKGGALSSFEGAAGVSLESRISNALVSYVWYLAKLL